MVYESVFHNGDIQNSKTTIQKDNLFGLNILFDDAHY